jgi:hypothetical protein
MTQLSRPYQIALVAIGLLAAVWFFALRGSSASTSGSGSSASAPAASSPAAKPAPPNPVYHGSAPGVEGLTREIAKARHAVAESQKNAKQLEEKSLQASSSAGAAAGTSTTGAQATSSVGRKGSATVHKAASSGAGPSQASRSKIGALPSMQRPVERELKQGRVVAILFWNPAAFVDQAVRRELQAVGHALGGKLAVHEARAKQVGSFGSFTRVVQVYQTPTILIVNKRGQASALTGLTDAFSIEQAIGEAKR